MRTRGESTVLRRVGQLKTSSFEVAKVLREILPEARQEHIKRRGQQGTRSVRPGGDRLSQLAGT